VSELVLPDPSIVAESLAKEGPKPPGFLLDSVPVPRPEGRGLRPKG